MKTYIQPDIEVINIVTEECLLSVSDTHNEQGNGDQGSRSHGPVFEDSDNDAQNNIWD